MFPSANNFWDNIDPKFITEEMYELGRQFLDKIKINWQWERLILMRLWSMGPIQIIVKYDDGERYFKNHKETQITLL